MSGVSDEKTPMGQGPEAGASLRRAARKHLAGLSQGLARLREFDLDGPAQASLEEMGRSLQAASAAVS